MCLQHTHIYLVKTHVVLVFRSLLRAAGVGLATHIPTGWQKAVLVINTPPPSSLEFREKTGLYNTTRLAPLLHMVMSEQVMTAALTFLSCFNFRYLHEGDWLEREEAKNRAHYVVSLEKKKNEKNKMPLATGLLETYQASIERLALSSWPVSVNLLKPNCTSCSLWLRFPELA